MQRIYAHKMHGIVARMRLDKNYQSTDFFGSFK